MGIDTEWPVVRRGIRGGWSRRVGTVTQRGEAQSDVWDGVRCGCWMLGRPRGWGAARCGGGGDGQRGWPDAGKRCAVVLVVARMGCGAVGRGRGSGAAGGVGGAGEGGRKEGAGVGAAPVDREGVGCWGGSATSTACGVGGDGQAGVMRRGCAELFCQLVIVVTTGVFNNPAPLITLCHECLEIAFDLYKKE